MARTVLIGALVVLALAGAAQAQPSAGTLACRGGGALGREVVQTAVSSPFFAFATRRSGPPQSCTITNRAGNLDARVSFPDGTALTIEASPDIGVAAYSLVLPARPDDARAIALLGRMANWALAPDGCGLTSTRLRGMLAGASGGEVEGDVCNCRAALSRGEGGTVTLSFSSAC